MQRRDFIISLSGAVGLIAAGCKKPINKLAPLVIPDEVNQTGAPVFYNTIYPKYGIPYPIRVKTIDGRPLKIDANIDADLNIDGTNATIQASIFSLYDPARFTAPEINKKKVKLAKALAYIKNKIKEVKEDKNIIIISQKTNSPLYEKLKSDISEKNSNVHFFEFSNSSEYYITVSFFNKLNNNTKKKVIISLGADILGISKYSLLIQNKIFSDKNRDNYTLLTAEPYLTQTGISSDTRELHNIEEMEILSTLIFHEISLKNNVYSIPFPIIPKKYEYLYNSQIIKIIQKTEDAEFFVFPAYYLSNSTKLRANKTNGFELLSPKEEYFYQFRNLNNIIKSKDIVILFDYNIYYSNYEIASLVDKIALDNRIYLSEYFDETANNFSVFIPLSNYLEDWDLQQYPDDNVLYIQQPVVQKLNKNSISKGEFLLNIFNQQSNEIDYYTYLRQYLNVNDKKFVEILQTGSYQTKKLENDEREKNILFSINDKNEVKVPNHLKLLAIPSPYHYYCQERNNPFLFELPHPITKLSWNNAAVMSKNTSKEFELNQGEIIKIKSGQKSIELPVLICNNCIDNLIICEYSYGNRIKNGLEKIGSNIFELTGNSFADIPVNVEIEKTGKKIELAISNHKKEIKIDQNIDEIDFEKILQLKNNKEKEFQPNKIFKKEFEYLDTKWEMEIDLSKCTGCNACVVACQIENNIPIVGEQEIKENRDMYWLKIQTYIFNSIDSCKGEFEPLMCQQCENAPCEMVCPVGATTHSPEGINEMTYNRCVGSRYCIVNCPYEIRVFNYKNYHQVLKAPLELLLNPNVTVRSRGVSEKCTFCIHRINEYEREIQLGNNPTKLQTACQQACPTGTIRFGNVRNKIFKINKDGYKLLEHLNTSPSITYVSKFKNNAANTRNI